MKYTKELHDYWIEDPLYLGRPPAVEPPHYAIVKRIHCEAYDAQTGEKRTCISHHLVIGWLEWNEKESCFELKSCGLRWLIYAPPQDVVDMVLDFAQSQEKFLNSNMMNS